MNLQEMEFWQSVRPPLLAGLLAGVLLFVLPLLWATPPAEGENPQVLPASPVPAVDSPQPSTVPVGEKDSNDTVRVLLADGTVEEQTMADYLWRVTAAEMPASFEPQALAAQAVCARTYTRWKASHGGGHEGADVCTDSSCCQAYITPEQAAENWGTLAEEYSAKIAAAVATTDGMVATYEGAPIQAVFFSSAAGRTVGAVEAWGNSVDYLVGVESPEGEEVPNYHSQVVLTAEEVRTAALAQYPGADLSGDPSGWFSQPVENSAGGVASVDLGGVTLTGSEVRTLFGLRSASFSVSWDGEAFTFDVTGYGHGVGMSQYGANAMAREGSDFEEILTWYYTGTEVGELYGAAGE